MRRPNIGLSLHSQWSPSLATIPNTTTTTTSITSPSITVLRLSSTPRAFSTSTPRLAAQQPTPSASSTTPTPSTITWHRYFELRKSRKLWERLGAVILGGTCFIGA
ncbi:hypothetical protein HK102_007890, partial [Quaeritorhiza haematococci]